MGIMGAIITNAAAGEYWPRVSSTLCTLLRRVVSPWRLCENQRCSETVLMYMGGDT